MFSVAQAIFKIAGALILIIVCLTSAHAASDVLTSQEGEVTVPVLNIRSGPGKSFRVVGKVQKGNRLVILAYQPRWLKISQANREGFVSREHIRLIPLKTPVGETSPAPFDPSKPPEAVENLKQEAGRIEKQIVEHEARVSTYTEKEAKLIDDLDQLGQLLNQTRLQVKKSREEGLLIETELKGTESEYLALQKEIALLDTYAAKRLVALYKLHQLGKMPVLASADSIFDLLGRKKRP